jgi:SAM-dependent methyltransferase
MNAPMSTLTRTPVACPACSHGPVSPLFNLGDYAIARCGKCGLAINRTFYDDPAFQASLFQSDYYDTNVAFDHRAQAYVNDPSLAFYAENLAWIEQRMTPGRVLDVGCAFGNFLKLAGDRGWTPSGVELSPYSSASARKAWGFEIFTGHLHDCPFDAGSFDLVTFWDVIEHVALPRADLDKARSLLKTGGYLLLATDDAEGLIATLGSLLYRGTFGLFRYPVRKFFIRYNSCYFTVATLSSLLERCGFAPRRVVPVDYPLAKLNVSGLERHLVRFLYAAGRLFRRQSQFLIIAEAV